MADDLGCNMIRCWGGNVYEDHAFFDLCDRTASWSGRTSRWPARYPAGRGVPRRDAARGAQCCPQAPQPPVARALVRRQRVRYALPRRPTKTASRARCCPTPCFAGRPLPPLPAQLALHRAWPPWVRPDMMPEQHLWGPRDYFKSDFYAEPHRALRQRDRLPRLPRRRRSCKQFLDARPALALAGQRRVASPTATAPVPGMTIATTTASS